MNNEDLYTEILSLPAPLQAEVADFIKNLKTDNQLSNRIEKREFGCGKGMFEMQDDFDEPLNDFKEYMY